jgi:hypothetical protein
MTRRDDPAGRRAQRWLAAALGALLAWGALVAAPTSAVADIGDQRGDEAQELAERYVPVVMTVAQDAECDTNGESFAPMAVDALLGNQEIALRQVSRGDPTAMRGPTAADLFGLGEGFYLDFPGNSLTPSCLYERDFRRFTAGESPVVYAHIVQQADRPDLLALQYWFYWYYNDWNNTHESDWEGIQLLFEASTITEALSGSPVSVGYSQHEGGERADWDASKLERDGDRPVVYSSAGSHASYFGAQVYIGRGASAGFGCDDTVGPSTRLDPEVVLLPSDVDDPDDPVAWLAFDGRWGERQSGPYNGPTGPRDKERWTHPVDWHDSLRSQSVVVPTGNSQGAQIVGTFCGVVEAGSGVVLQAANSPTTVAIAAVVLFLLVRWLARRTDWSRVPVRPLVARRRAGQIIRGSVRALVRERPVPILFGWVYLPVVVLAAALIAVGSLLPIVGVLFDLLGGDGGTSLFVALFASGTAGSLGVFVVGALIAVEWSSPDAGLTHRHTLQLAAARWRELLVTFGLALVIVVALLVSIVGIPWGVRQLVRYGLIGQVVIVEGRSGADALARSSELVRGRWWHTAVVLGALNMTTVATQLLVGLLLLIVTDGVPLWLFSAILPFVTSLVVPLVAIGTTLLYGDAVAEEQGDGADDPDESVDGAEELAAT